MKIRMTQTQPGSEDGTSLQTYQEGETYDLSFTPRQVELAEVFVREGWAVAVEAAPAPVAPPADTPAPLIPDAPPADAPAPLIPDAPPA